MAILHSGDFANCDICVITLLALYSMFNGLYVEVMKRLGSDPVLALLIPGPIPQTHPADQCSVCLKGHYLIRVILFHHVVQWFC